MKNIIFIAPPAAGKGTQSAKVSAKYGIPHISMGQLLRDEIIGETEIGLSIKETVAHGNLIDEEISSKILLKRLQKKDCDNGYVLDGFPRSRSQIPYLEEILAEIEKVITHVFLINIDRDLALKRTIGRRVCSNCDANYNILFEDSTPKVENKCDKCSGTLLKREDDTEEVFNHRYNIYMEESAEIIKYFKDLNILHEIDGSISKEYTFSEICKILGE